jgi:hypothetical protein
MANRPKHGTTEWRQVSLRVDAEQHLMLTLIAQRRERSVAALAATAVADWLAKDEQLFEIREAIDVVSRLDVAEPSRP